MPISYSLCTLDMHSVGTSMFVDYVSRQCHPSPTKYKIIWETLICEVNDDGGEGEDVKAMVRIRAFDKNNKDILDEDKFNQNMLKVIEKGLPYKDFFWTFTKGNEDNPLLLNKINSLR